MTQHITKEQAVALSIKSGDEFAIHETEFYTNLCNSAIQHYIDQRAKDLPVLREVTTFDQGMDGSMEPVEDGAWVRSDVFYDHITAYGAACAVHAREQVLEEAKQLILKLGLMVTDLKGYEAIAAIETLKKNAMTTPNEKLIRNLTIKAGVMEMGEKIAWGSDTALMRQAAHALQSAKPVAQPGGNITIPRSLAESILQAIKIGSRIAPPEYYGSEENTLFGFIEGAMSAVLKKASGE